MVARPFGVMQIVLTPVEEGRVKATAHKCDLCDGREEGPACVQNCPAGGAGAGDGQYADESGETAASARGAFGSSRRGGIGVFRRKSRADGRDAAARRARQTNCRRRRANFAEIYLPFTAGQANREAERCLKRGEHSICEWTCPLHNHIPQWIERVKEGISPPPLSFLIRPTACRK